MNPVDAEDTQRILVADADPAVHGLIRSAIANHHGRRRAMQLDSAYDVEEAVQQVKNATAFDRSYAMAFVDAALPGGQETVEAIVRLWSLDPELRVVLCAAENVPLAPIVESLEGTDRLLVLRKPLDPIQVRLTACALAERQTTIRSARTQIGSLASWAVDAERVLKVLEDSHSALEKAHVAAQNRAAELARQLQKRTAESIGTRNVTVLALARLAESRDPETGEHLERMQTYTQILARHLAKKSRYADQIDEQFLEDLFRSSPLHDIGKVGIPDEILLKPGPLTIDEFTVMKRHAEIGAEALRQVAGKADYAGFIDMAAGIALHHHERFDGRGYPGGLRGIEIPLPARIVALADVFDALTSVRIYKDAVSPHVTRRLIERETGRHFDPVVVEAFRDCYSEFLEVHEGRRRRSAAGTPPESLTLVP